MTPSFDCLRRTIRGYIGLKRKRNQPSSDCRTHPIRSFFWLMMNHLYNMWILGCLAPLLFVMLGCEKRSRPLPRSVVDAIGQKQTNAKPFIEVSNADESSHQRMLRRLSELADLASADNRYYGNAMARTFRSLESSDKLTKSPTKRLQFDVQHGMFELRLGHERDAIQRLKSGYDRAHQLYSQEVISKSTLLNAVFRLGLAYLRLGETQNCCLRHNADSCLLPIRGGGLHTEEEGSREAIRYFTEVLEASDGEHKDSKLYYETVWLLNIAYMTLGEHPHSVPEAYRIESASYGEETNFPRFMNIASHVGIDNFTMSGGAIADDFDNDGRIDLVVGSWDLRENLKIYRNVGNNRFTDQTTQAGLTGIAGGLNMLQADYNNDGHLDVFVLRGAWLLENGEHPNSLLRNNGNGTFTDVTYAAGLAEPSYPTQTAAWADYDLDGDLDLYVGNEPISERPSPSQLFRNNGDGTFTDVATTAGVENRGFTKSVLWGDVDNDRYPDLFVSNLHGENRLYRNHGGTVFVDESRSAGLHGFTASFPAFFWDFNNDGRLDLYVASYAAATDLLAQKYLGREVTESLSRLYRGDGKGRFHDVAIQCGLDEPTFAMGVNFGDLDNDGYLDFYLGTGDIDFRHLVPNKMYRNRKGQAFEDVSYSGGFSHLQKGHAVVFADFDLDGDLDLFEQMGGAYQGDKYSDAYYQNPGFEANWLQIDAIGTDSNRSAIGTKLTVHFRQAGLHRVVHRQVNSGGSFGANPLRETIGLGSSDSVDRLEVYWPKTDKTQVFQNIAPNQVIRVTENDSDYTRLDL